MSWMSWMWHLLYEIGGLCSSRINEISGSLSQGEVAPGCPQMLKPLVGARRIEVPKMSWPGYSPTTSALIHRQGGWKGQHGQHDMMFLWIKREPIRCSQKSFWNMALGAAFQNHKHAWMAVEFLFRGLRDDKLWRKNVESHHLHWHGTCLDMHNISSYLACEKCPFQVWRKCVVP